MSERTAWFCPSCQKHHAPHVETCPGPVDAISRIPLPTYPAAPGTPAYPRFPAEPSMFKPSEWYKLITADPCGACKGPCGNVACPKLTQITWLQNGIATTGGIQ